jgi:hypothetical protein
MMDERLEKLERAVAALEVALKRQERRIAAIEGVAADAPAVAGNAIEGMEPVDPSPEAHPDQWPISAVRGTPALVGRSLLILAGAFLLRALTEAGTLANPTGVVLGLAYAASWIIAAAMAARKGARGSAGFFAVCAALIADPLIFEASTEFGVLSPTGSAFTLAIMTAAGLFVAARWRLQESAWVFVVGTMMTAAILAVVRPPGEAGTTVLVVLGLVAVWLAGRHGWEFMRWLTAVGANVGVLRLTAMATVPGGPHGVDPPNLHQVVLLQVALLIGYVGSSFARAVRGRNPVRLFDYLQTATACAIGWGGAVQIARAHGSRTEGLSVFALLVGLAAYAGAFGVVDRKFGRNRSFVFLSSLGLALVLLGLPGIVGSASAVVWAILALITAAAGSHWDRVTLRVHAVVLLVTAWIASGVAAEIAGDISGRTMFDGMPGALATIVALLTVITTLVVLFSRRLKESGWAQRLPLTAMLIMSGIVAATTLVWVAALVAPDSVVWIWTVALSGLTIAAAVLASRWGVREAGWIVYPLLALTGLRVLLADLASDRTVVFVIALTAYGTALILSPKLLRSSRTQTRN